MFANRQSLRALPVCFFTGGVVKANGICSACFLRKQRCCGEVSACQQWACPLSHRCAMPAPPSGELDATSGSGLRGLSSPLGEDGCERSFHYIIGIIRSKTVHTTPAKEGQGSFPPAEKPADCASCTENALFDKTEKIKKKIRSFF